MDNKETDLQLARRILTDMKDGDFQSFNSFYATYHPILLKYAKYDVFPDGILADDIVAQFWLDVIRKDLLENFSAKAGSSIKSYFIRIIKNKISDHFRKKGNQSENFFEFNTIDSSEGEIKELGWENTKLSDAIDGGSGCFIEPPDIIIQNEINSKRKEMLDKYITTLGEPKHSILIWHLAKNSGEEICRRLKNELGLDLQEATVRKHISRIKVSLTIMAQRHREWEELGR